jgi:hypothetical protein
MNLFTTLGLLSYIRPQIENAAEVKISEVSESVQVVPNDNMGTVVVVPDMGTVIPDDDVGTVVEKVLKEERKKRVKGKKCKASKCKKKKETVPTKAYHKMLKKLKRLPCWVKFPTSMWKDTESKKLELKSAYYIGQVLGTTEESKNKKHKKYIVKFLSNRKNPDEEPECNREAEIREDVIFESLLHHPCSGSWNQTKWTEWLLNPLNIHQP